MKKYQLLAFFLLPFCTLQAQEQLGVRLSNYGGINSTLLNPAYHTTTPFRWDVNLLEGAGHITNDYAYLRRTWRTDKLDRAYAGIAHQEAWETGPILGLGMQLGPFWYPAPMHSSAWAG